MELKLTREQAAKVAAKKARHENQVKVDPEWYFVAEFGSFYGWEGIMAILEDKIDIETANLLLMGARKVRANHLIQDAMSSQVGFSSAINKKPKETFKKGIKAFQNEAKL